MLRKNEKCKITHRHITVLKSNRNIVETEVKSISLKHIHDRSLSGIGRRMYAYV